MCDVKSWSYLYSIQGMGTKNQYTKWLGALLIIKMDEKKCLIACDRNYTFYIPEGIDWLVCSG